MADSVASPQSRPSRAASKKRRHATVSTDTENKLARAARSAQRLAQLSDASRDDSTLDLFPDDPTRATLEAMNIDIRQGTLHGFELPDVVLAAVGAIDGGDSASLDSRMARRAPRAAKSDEPVPVNAQLSGLEIEPSTAAVSPVGELAFGDAKPATQSVADEKPMALVPLTPAMAAATVARSVTALRQAAEPGSMGVTSGAASSPGMGATTGAMAGTTTGTTTGTTGTRPGTTPSTTPGTTPGPTTAAATSASTASTLGGAKAPQRFAATSAKAASASAWESDSESESGSASRKAAAAETATTADEPTSTNADAAPVEPKAGTQTLAPSSTSSQASAKVAAPSREARRAEAAAAAPELDRARATAFADTVDALYGVIADQRRAATDHSRRMKWMLSIVVGALLATVAIGITQTVLLMRLTHETTAQQHRIEQMMQNQQAAMTSLLDTHMAMATSAAATAASDAAAAAAPQQAAAAPAHTRHAGRAPHPHKPKAAISH